MTEPATSVAAMIAEARREVRGLSVAEFDEVLKKRSAVIVDIRDVRERWREGAVPGARHAPRGMLEFWADPASEYYKPFFQPDEPVVLYCAGGQRSKLAARTLQRLGYSNVADLEVGFDEWKRQGGDWEEVPVPDR